MRGLISFSSLTFIPKPWSSSAAYDWGINVEDASDRLPETVTLERETFIGGLSSCLSWTVDGGYIGLAILYWKGVGVFNAVELHDPGAMPFLNGVTNLGLAFDLAGVNPRGR